MVEQCGKCHKQFRRHVVTPNLGRACEECGGRLHKTGTRMGAATPEEPLGRAIDHAKRADLALVMGSSMTVGPFCQLSLLAKRFVIVNLQTTPYDGDAHMCIHARTDFVLRELVSFLGVTVPPLQLSWPFHLRWQPSAAQSDAFDVRVMGGYPNEPPTLVRRVALFASSAGPAVSAAAAAAAAAAAPTTTAFDFSTATPLLELDQLKDWTWTTASDRPLRMPSGHSSVLALVEVSEALNCAPLTATLALRSGESGSVPLCATMTKSWSS